MLFFIGHRITKFIKERGKTLIVKREDAIGKIDIS